MAAGGNGHARASPSHRCTSRISYIACPTGSLHCCIAASVHDLTVTPAPTLTPTLTPILFSLPLPRSFSHFRLCSLPLTLALALQTEDSYGSMLELAWKGTKPLAMPDGSKRVFLQVSLATMFQLFNSLGIQTITGTRSRRAGAHPRGRNAPTLLLHHSVPDCASVPLQDGDTVTMRGWCEKDGMRVGLGCCTGKILPATPFVDPAAATAAAAPAAAGAGAVGGAGSA